MIASSAPCTGFYLFCDIRGFSSWMAANQLEAVDLLDPFYSAAFGCFGGRTDQTYRKRVAKLLGDGFMVVHEYEKNNAAMFSETLRGVLTATVEFRDEFYLRLRESTIHGKRRLRCSLGLAFGPGVRLTIPGYPLDYVSDRINFASRLAGVAEADELVFEEELRDEIVSSGAFGTAAVKHDERELKKIGPVEVGVVRLGGRAATRPRH